MKELREEPMIEQSNRTVREKTGNISGSSGRARPLHTPFICRRSQKRKRKQYCRQETRSWDNYSGMENTSFPNFSPLPGKRQLAKCLFDLNRHFIRGSEAKG